MPVDAFLAGLKSEQRRQEGLRLCQLLQHITGKPPVMWGPSIIGFGRYHYRYASGHEGDAAAIGFSPRPPALVIYLADGVEHYPGQLRDLGPHTTGVSCLYIKRLDDVNLKVLEAIFVASYRVVMTTIHKE